MNCQYCFLRSIKVADKKDVFSYFVKLLRNSRNPAFAPHAISFTGPGKPLRSMGRLGAYMRFLKRIEKKSRKRPWYYLYTNGIMANNKRLLQLRDLGFDEIRFHLGASHFSEEVYGNLKRAIKRFKAVIVETPSWPPHRHNT